VALACVVAMSGCAGSNSTSTSKANRPGDQTGTKPNSAADDTSPPETTPTTTDVGALVQTTDRPTSTGTDVAAGGEALWNAIVDDKPDLAMPFFFPRSAYHQVKILRDPDKDWQSRLVDSYTQDIHALHQTLGTQVADAKLIGIEIPDGAARWINPHEEYNKIGYWRVYGSTLNYKIAGKTVRVPIYSLISWRGTWYIVHLNKPAA